MSHRDAFDFLQIFGLGKHKNKEVDYLFKNIQFLKLLLQTLRPPKMFTAKSVKKLFQLPGNIYYILHLPYFNFALKKYFIFVSFFIK